MRKNLTNLAKIIKKTNKQVCKGKIYRCKINIFINKNKELIYQIRMRPMLRLSCKGCESCCFLEEYLHDLYPGEGVVIDKEPVNNALYELVYIPDLPDWESGISESGTLFLKRIKE